MRQETKRELAGPTTPAADLGFETQISELQVHVNLFNCLSFKILKAGSALLVLTACASQLETVTEPISKPQETSFSSSTDQEVCETALDSGSTQTWNTATDSQEAVIEAENRTLTPKACTQLLDRMQRREEPVEASENEVSDLSQEPPESVCRVALAESMSNSDCNVQRDWATESNKQRFVNEVKRRRLTAKDCCRLVYPPTPETKRTASGTGFLINNRGHIVTSYHVVEKCSKIEVRHDEIMHTAKIIQSDNVTDLALLQAKLKEDYGTLRLSSEDPAKMVEIFAAGYPFGNEGGKSLRFEVGSVSGSSGPPDSTGQDDQNLLQINAAVNPGNSGGPLVNKSTGKVVGVILGKFQPKDSKRNSPDSMNYAIKVSVLTRFLELHNIPFDTISLLDLFRPKDVRDVIRDVEESTLYVSCSEPMTE